MTPDGSMIHRYYTLDGQDELLTIPEAAALAKVTAGTLYNWVSKGRLTREYGLHYRGEVGEGRRPRVGIWKHAFMAWVNAGCLVS